jgi:hypothetical protein
MNVLYAGHKAVHAAKSESFSHEIRNLQDKILTRWVIIGDDTRHVFGHHDRKAGIKMPV